MRFQKFEITVSYRGTLSLAERYTRSLGRREYPDSPRVRFARRSSTLCSLVGRVSPRNFRGLDPTLPPVCSVAKALAFLKLQLHQGRYFPIARKPEREAHKTQFARLFIFGAVHKSYPLIHLNI